MSLQNLYEPNNEELYCKNLELEILEVNTLEAGTNAEDGHIILYDTMVAITDEAVSLGGPGQGFNNLYCRTLCGLNGPVAVLVSINGNPTEVSPGVEENTPLVISNTTPSSGINAGITGPGSAAVAFPNGILFGLVSSGYSRLSYYGETTGTFTNGGCYSGVGTPVTYVATRIGNIIQMGIVFGNPGDTAPNANVAGGPISLSGLPTPLHPTVNSYVSIPILSNVTRAMGILRISGGTVSIYNGLAGTESFVPLLAACYSQPLGTRFDFSYSL